MISAVRRLIRSTLGSLLLYLAISVAILLPVIRHPATLMPTGATQVGTVPLFNAWTIWWNADRLWHGFRHYWDAPIFAPSYGTFAFSEPQPATMIVAPIIWIADSPVLAYNVYLLISLMANGVFGQRLLRSLGVNRLYSAAGGAAILLLPQVHEQLDVLQLVPIWTILWTVESVIRLGRQPEVRNGLTAGIAFGLTFWISIHHALFLAVLLLVTLPLFPVQWRSSRTWSAAAAGLMVAGLLSLPLVLPMRRIMEHYRFERTTGMVDRLSAKPAEFLTAPGTGFLERGLVSQPGQRRRLPGWLNSGFAMLTALLCMVRRRRRRDLAFLVAISTMSLLLALGTNLKLGDWQPWWTLTGVIPGLSLVRNVFRFAYFFQLSVVVLGFFGLWRLRILCHGRSTRVRTIVKWGTTAICLLSVAELCPRPYLTVGCPTVERHRGWIQWIRQNRSPGESVLFLPYVKGSTVAEFDLTVRMMFLSTQFRAPLVNGYSGYFPQSHFQLQTLLQDGFPTDAALQYIGQAGVGHIVVLRDQFPQSTMVSSVSPQWQLEPGFGDESGFDVYRIIPRGGAESVAE